MISARTSLFAVIGDPISHSLSPVMQNYFISLFGLDAVYTAFHVKPKEVPACIQGMRAMGIRGLNVTVPHKEAVLAHVDSLSEEVQLLGAANTLKNQDGAVRAFVTDPFGFEESVSRHKDRFDGARVLMFGAGGAARSVAYALKKLGVGELIIADLVQQKAAELVELCRSRLQLKKTRILDQGQVGLKEILRHMDIVINATALGMHPHEDKAVIEDFSAIGRTHFFYDLVYNPGKTRFLKLAEEAGATIQNGLDMLIFQGLQSLRIWTGESLHLGQQELAQVRTLMKKQLGIDE